MTRIFIEDSFDSAHRLPNVPPHHKCRRLHGHTYRVRIEVTGAVGKTTGWVVDYGDLKALWLQVKQDLDHCYLNKIPELRNSTCENLAAYILERMRTVMRGVSRVELRETERCGVVVE